MGGRGRVRRKEIRVKGGDEIGMENKLFLHLDRR